VSAFYLIGFVIPIALLIVGLSAGRIIESAHLRDLDAREQKMSGIGISNLDPEASARDVQVIGYVDGQAVIAADRFKTMLSLFRKIFGGEIRSLVTVMSRARREAVLRMLEEAQRLGADQVWNMRIETSSISRPEGAGQQQGIKAEVHAYGTAVRLRRP
jgi:uncharacterized protein YbjQ (UPF0145 family)